MKIIKIKIKQKFLRNKSNNNTMNKNQNPFTQEKYRKQNSKQRELKIKTKQQWKQNPQKYFNTKKIKQNQQKLQKAYLNKSLYHKKTTQSSNHQQSKNVKTQRINHFKTLTPKISQNIKQNFRITKGVKFSKAKRYLSQAHYKLNDPSPNQYKYQCYEKNKNSPKFSFGKQDKFFKTRKDLKCKTQIPGPGKYQQIKSENKGSIIIPQGQRLGLQTAKDVPGVGSYEIEKQYLKHKIVIKFSQQKRRSLTNPIIAPGPNKYFTQKIQSFNTNHQTFNKQKKMLLKIDKIPGVGQYSIDRFQQKHSPCARISQSQIKQRYKKMQRQKYPGPGQYNSCQLKIYKPESKLTNVIFNRSANQSPKNAQHPGVGQYNISQKRIKIKGGLLTSRQYYRHTQQIPGPAAYQPKINFIASKSISARIGTQQRLRPKIIQNPGPNDYHPQKAKIHFNSTGFVFPKSKRSLF